MRRLALAALAAFAATTAQAGALSTYGTFCGTFPAECRRAPLLVAKGTDNNVYMVEVDQTTGLLPVSATASFTTEGATGSAAPARAIEVAGVDGGGVLRALKTSTAGVVSVDGSGVTQPVSGTFWQATQPVSAASLPLPTGAATAAKQPALGTAGSASADVLSVQGVASMTALKVDGSAVTQPVSGTFWQATQPVSGTVTANAGSGTMAVSLAAAPIATGTYADSVRYTYVTAAVGTSSWVQLIASTAAVIHCVEIFDSSGQTLELGTGAASSETRKLIIPPGGLDGCVPLTIPASTRVSIRALSATTGAVGEINITGIN